MKRSLSTISQSIERWMKPISQGRDAQPRSGERVLWTPTPHPTLSCVRHVEAKAKRSGALNGRRFQYSPQQRCRRSGATRIGSLVELVVMSLTLTGIVVAIPIMINSCNPSFADISSAGAPKLSSPQSISVPANELAGSPPRRSEVSL